MLRYLITAPCEMLGIAVKRATFPMHFKMILNLEFTNDDSQLEYHLNKKRMLKTDIVLEMREC